MKCGISNPVGNTKDNIVKQSSCKIIVNSNKKDFMWGNIWREILYAMEYCSVEINSRIAVF